MFSAHYVRIQRFCVWRGGSLAVFFPFFLKTEKHKSYNILPLSLYFHFHDEMLIGFLEYTQV